MLTDEWISARAAEIPELPAARRSRYAALGLPEYDVGVLTQEPEVAGYFESVMAGGTEAKTAANWVMGEVLAAFNESGHFAVEPARVSAVAALVADGTVSLQAAKRIYAELASADGEPREIAQRLGLVQVR
ncbi:MAG TPA: Asp-tRNA(Asn)/Glu-tRNA(Gln) amidotransferase GatCAB subunit B, partial [Gemmatimonadales bacterium]|nr:Asp-tRNA(Asn)/Glu-tRNA(Gln) amidotransferase GatCAB subunit B [Gemmatimonadales bacterium]